jgi:hypothetical protein
MIALSYEGYNIYGLTVAPGALAFKTAPDTLALKTAPGVFPLR